ncbi:TolC family protein [Gemmatimonas aurantiaca]|uniref:TolC family protein n=1 Tax=Gemmatimonas aurantiaca TaxID=173480 RepID=UPI00301D2DF8
MSSVVGHPAATWLRAIVSRAACLVGGPSLLLLPALGAAAAQNRVPPDPREAGSSVQGDSIRLSLEQMRSLVLSSAPAYLAIREEFAVARGVLRQASILPFNPDLALNIPGTGPTQPRNPVEINLMQEIEWAGQRGLRRRATRAGVSLASAIIYDAARQSIAEASKAFYAAEASLRRLEVVRASAEFGRRLLEAVQLQLREGEISILEANLAEIEAGRARARVIGEQRQQTARLVELKRVVGMSVDAKLALEPSASASDTSGMPAVSAARPVAPVVDDSGQVRDLDSLVNAAIGNRADIRAFDAQISEVTLRAQLTRREAIPNVRLGVYMERMPGEQGLRLGPAFGFGLPLWNRNQGTADALAARRRQLELDRRAAVLRVRAQIVTAASAYVATANEIAIYARTVLQPARTNGALLETAYRAGKIPLPTLLLLRNQLLDAELGYWDAWLLRQQSLVELESALGGPAIAPSDAELPSLTTQESHR